MSFELFLDTDDSTEVIEVEEKPASNRLPPLQCLCGRFAKSAGGRGHYYNGNFNCYSYDVDCSRCGIVTIECV